MLDEDHNLPVTLSKEHTWLHRVGTYCIDPQMKTLFEDEIT